MIRYDTFVNLNADKEDLVDDFLKEFSSIEIRDRKKCSMPIYSVYWKSKKATIKDYSEKWKAFDQLRDSLFLKEEYR